MGATKPVTKRLLRAALERDGHDRGRRASEPELGQEDALADDADATEVGVRLELLKRLGEALAELGAGLVALREAEVVALVQVQDEVRGS